MEIIFEIIINLFGILFMLVMFVFPVGLAILYSANKARKENLDKIDFSKEKEYYRDILEGYTPAEISYVDNLCIKTRREIVATLLNLKLKNKIEITKNKIVVIDSSIEGLRKTEKYILQNINEGRVQIEKIGAIELYAQQEAEEDNLIKKNTMQEKRERIKRMIMKKTVIGIGMFCLFALICINVEKINEIENQIFANILIFLIIILSISFFRYFSVAPIMVLTYSVMQIDSYSRTAEGNLLNKKIEGLKKFIKDYSLLNQKEQKDMIFWDEYLIYSVIFDINSTSIVEEISKLIDIKFEPEKILFSNVK